MTAVDRNLDRSGNNNAATRQRNNRSGFSRSGSRCHIFHSFSGSISRLPRQTFIMNCFSRHRRACVFCYSKLTENPTMLTFEQDESTFRIRHNSYLLALIFLCIPPALLYEHYGDLLDDSIKTGELVGFWIGILLPLVGAYFFTEFASFSFHKQENVFRWRWRNLFKKKSGEVPLSRIVKVRRDALEGSDSTGLQYSYRLGVILDHANDHSIEPQFFRLT